MIQIDINMPIGCIYEGDNGKTEYCPLCNHDDVPYCQYLDDDEAALGIDERPCYCPLYKSESQWIPCSERLPEEHDSIFSKLYGTEKWRDAMFRKTSNTVIITVEFKDGTRQTAPCHTIDGEWNQSMKGMGKVLAWCPLPEPYKEKE